MAEQGSGGMRPMYFVWAWLVGLTAVEVVLAYLKTPLFWMLVSLLGLSLVKAALIMAYFMHLKFERLNLVLTLIPALVLTILLLNIFYPDAMRLKSHGVNRDVTFQEETAAEAGH
jgi:cytochrome c oxidase subunit 4